MVSELLCCHGPRLSTKECRFVLKGPFGVADTRLVASAEAEYPGCEAATQATISDLRRPLGRSTVPDANGRPGPATTTPASASPLTGPAGPAAIGPLTPFADARVLVIDDNPANVALIEAMLTLSGLKTVTTYTDPCEALAELDAMDPDLIVLDLHMPNVDGYSVLGRLAERSDGGSLPVLVLTADATPEATRRALGLGASDLLTKPFDTTEIVLRVRNLLETRLLYRALRHDNLRLREQLTGYQLLESAERAAWQLARDTIERLIAGGNINMVYQPVFELGGLELVGVEALARFPEAGSQQLFAAAANVGLGTALEVTAVRAALRALDALPEHAYLAINVSPATVLSGELDDVCRRQVGERVVLELTEHVPVEDYDAIASALTDLRAAGVRLAADDTGAGFAGFHHLLALNPDIVKLDISLTRGIDKDPARRALATALITFTHGTGRQLIAEGIETAAELRTLQDLGTPWGQGFHLGRPQPLSQLQACLRSPIPSWDRSVTAGS